MSTDESLRLKLDATPENVAVARAAVGELAHGLGIEGSALGDVKTVVSEACANVVRHAYPDGPGNFEVEASGAGSAFSIIVRDFGIGLQPDAGAERSTLRLGFGLISKLATRFEIAGGSGGTEIRAELPLPR